MTILSKVGEVLEARRTPLALAKLGKESGTQAGGEADTPESGTTAPRLFLDRCARFISTRIPGLFLFALGTLAMAKTS